MTTRGTGLEISHMLQIYLLNVIGTAGLFALVSIELATATQMMHGAVFLLSRRWGPVQNRARRRSIARRTRSRLV